jgi:hypothetical protein
MAWTSARVSRIHRALIAVLVTTYLAAAVVGVTSGFVDNKVLWAVALGGSAAFIVIGAFVGGVLLIPLVLPPIAAAFLVMLTYSLSRRPSAA